MDIKELMITSDEGNSFTFVDDSATSIISCISPSERLFYTEWSGQFYVDNLNFYNKMPYNLDPTLSDVEKAGLLRDRNNDGVINDEDIVASKNPASAIPNMNCNNHPMFGNFNTLGIGYSALFSYDQGRTWFSSSTPRELKYLPKFVATVDDAGGMWLPSATGLIRSTNGRDWIAVDFDELISSMINSPKTQDHLLAISESGKLYESFNNGSDWELSGQLAEDEGGFTNNAYWTPRSLLAVADDGEIVASGHVASETQSLRIYRSFNNGKTWEPLPSEGVSTPENLFMTPNYYWSISTRSGLNEGVKLYRLARH